MSPFLFLSAISYSVLYLFFEFKVMLPNCHTEHKYTPYFRTKYLALFSLSGCHQVFALPRSNSLILTKKRNFMPLISFYTTRKPKTSGLNFKQDKKLKLKTLTRIIYSKKVAILPSCIRHYALRFIIQISLNTLVVDYINYD